MLPEDWPVWDMFLDLYGGEFKHFYYDVRVGGPKIEDPAINPKMAKMWYDLNAKRIDALGEKEDEVWIIEVAASPGLRALGQLTTYLALWWEDPKPPKKAIPVLVGERIDHDLKKALWLYGMRSCEIR